MSLREKKLSFNSISTRLNAIYHFYDMNDVSLNKKKIKMFKGENQRKVVDRAYMHEDIKKILDVSDLRAKTIVLLMAFSGLRIGALPDLRLRNLEKIDSLYKITVYEGSNSQYFTFCSPECSSYINAYLHFRTMHGENLNKDSFLIREQFDISDLEQINQKKELTLDKEQTIYDDLLDGVRSPYFNPYTLSSNTDRKVVGHERLDYNIPLSIRFRCGDQLMSYSTVNYNALLYMID